jgi:hypothetical protein
MLVDYFLRSGYYNTALKLAQDSSIEVWLETTFLEIANAHFKHEYRGYLTSVSVSYIRDGAK